MANRNKFFKPLQIGALALAVAATGMSGWAFAQQKKDDDKISKFLLIKLSREQSQFLCAASEFTSCMGFTEQACIEISEKALQQCIMPLPDTVLLENLNSDVLEACPEKVYEEAGYSNEKAGGCLLKAMNK